MTNVVTLRAVPRDIAESRALFLCLRASEVQRDSPARRECLEQLTRSPNAAIADRALQLMAPLRMMK